MEIKYNKEYYELIRAFIPGAKNEGYSIKIKDEFLILDLHGEILETPIDKSKFPNNEKNFIKYHLYKILEKYTHKSLQWGILLGIRPVKLVRSIVHEIGIDKGVKILKEDYLISDSKIELSLRVIEVQRHIIENHSSGYSLYVDIPFCPSICNYCSFPTFIPNEDRVDTYMKNLFMEIDSVSRYLKKEPTCIYVGGGTPSAIGAENLQNVIIKLLNTFGRPKELTVEVGRPDTINLELLEMLKNSGVDRISINPQTMKDETLKLMGRKHSSEEVVESYKAASDMGIRDINMDIIIGLLGEEPKDFYETLKEIEILNPTSLSIHALALKKGSRIYDSEYENSESKEFEKIRDEFTKEHEYIPYYLYRQKNILLNIENIGYSKRGYESIYNILMMEDAQSIIGLGLGASSKVLVNGNFERHINTKDLRQYMENIESVIEDKEKYLKEQLNEA